MPGPFFMQVDTSDQIIRSIAKAGNASYLESFYTSQAFLLRGIADLSTDAAERASALRNAETFEQLAARRNSEKLEARAEFARVLNEVEAQAEARGVSREVRRRFRTLMTDSLALTEGAGEAAGIDAQISSASLGPSRGGTKIRQSASRLLVTDTIIRDVEFVEAGTGVVVERLPGIRSIVRSLFTALGQADTRPAPEVRIQVTPQRAVIARGDEAIFELFSRQGANISNLNREVRTRAVEAEISIAPLAGEIFIGRIVATPQQRAARLAGSRVAILQERTEAIIGGRVGEEAVRLTRPTLRVTEQLESLRARIRARPVTTPRVRR